MKQLSLFPECMPDDGQAAVHLRFLRDISFDTRQRIYENEAAYQHRMLMSWMAFQQGLWPDPDHKRKWVNLTDRVELCPTGKWKNRLPPDRKELTSQACHYLRIRDVQVGYWSVPKMEKTWIANELPTRATFIPSYGDVFLSRFREPLGKSAIYQGEINPLYISSNFLLLRPVQGIDPLVLTAIIKSSLLAAQIHVHTRRGSVITEMHQQDARKILFPAVSGDLADEILGHAKERLAAEQRLIELEGSIPGWDTTRQIEDEKQRMCQMDVEIDMVLYRFLIA